MNTKTSSYSTKQKKLILEIFEKHKDKHLTIDEISLYLTQNCTPVGTTTIYRQTQRLLDEGLIRKYSLGSNNKACFQYVSNNSCSEHFHLKCTSCQKLFHASCSFLNSIGNHIFEHHEFSVDNTRTVFYGTCKNCKEKLNNK